MLNRTRYSMNKIFYRQLSNFRDTFVSNVGGTECRSWFPGHMYKGILQMQAKLAVVDCIIEVHDARIPFSGRNPKFYSMLTAVKPHVLVLNKCDTIDFSLQKEIKDRLLKENVQNVLFTNCKANKRSGVDKVISTAVELIKMSEKFNRGLATSLSIMVIGVPNVGKSSLINKLRNIHLKKGKASSVGAIPGVTRSVLEKIKISDDPLVYLFDTPGVMTPVINNLEVGLRLALCRTLKDDLVGETLIADYLLYWLNKHKHFSYVEFFKMDKATDDIRLLLLHIAKEYNMVLKIRNVEATYVSVPDVLGASNHFIKCFRDGKFGKLFLDMDILNQIS